ncbi:MAG TPA: P-loop NTPase fold protein [Candidatus Moranbacteria bacterium]|nr:P-loop NTPase fold protein [Candidatus Moranbacteria bacterium]
MDTKLKSREQFIQQVSDTIKSNHSKHSDSFIFGISGKWGEGKTTFLRSLEYSLNKEGFTVVDFNPWKFASDKVSFLRSFLALIKSKINKKLLDKCKDWIFNRNDTLNLYYDVSSNKIHIGWFIFSIVVMLAIPAIYSRLPLEYRNAVKEFKWAITLLAIPAVALLFGKMVSVQKSSKAVSTLDSFENLLNQYIKQFDGIKLVVFVDDLDRVTPEVARNVLDNLRTFFDKKELTFIVAGDHTVLERYLGQDLLPKGGEPEKIEEGRRFLKKIFNVYWRLPLPIDSELRSFVDETFAKKSDEISGILPKVEDQTKFKEYLSGYFEKNFRHILRFLDTTLFTFGIIKNLKEASDEGNKNYFVEMENNPLLVIRILMIQELCAPLFEKIIEDVDLLSALEYAADKQNNDSINFRIESLKNMLSPSQKNFILKFLFEKPRFFDGAILKVSDIRPFLYLAADAGFGDSRGVSADDFALIVDRGNPDEIKQVLIASGEGKITAGADKFVEKANSIPDYNQRNACVNTVVKALSDISADYKLHSIFLEKTLALDFEFYKQFPSQNRIENYKIFWQWLDKHSESDLTEKYKEKFVFINNEDFNYFSEYTFGKFSSAVVIDWLVKYYSQDKQLVLTKIQDMAPRMNKGIVSGDIAKIAEDMINDTAHDADNNLRSIRYNILAKYAEDKKPKLKEAISERISNMDDAIWTFAISKVNEEGALLTKKEMEEIVLNKLSSLQDISQFFSILRFSVGRIQTLLDDLWKIIIEKHTDFLIDNIQQIINDTFFQPIAPNKESAKLVFNRFIEKVKELDDSQKVERIRYAEKGKWLWANVDKIDKRKFSAFSKSQNEQIVQSAKAVEDTWFPANTVSG